MLDGEKEGIEQNIIEICFHMKGVTWEEAWAMSPEYRGKIIKYVNRVYEEQQAAMTGQEFM